MSSPACCAFVVARLVMRVDMMISRLTEGLLPKLIRIEILQLIELKSSANLPDHLKTFSI
jgi:hypothetical protein